MKRHLFARVIPPFFAAMMVGVLLIFLCVIQKLCSRSRPCRECDDEDDEDFRR